MAAGENFDLCYVGGGSGLEKSVGSHAAQAKTQQSSNVKMHANVSSGA